MTLYDLIADLRREHPTPATTQTLDMLVAQLGRTRDNLKSAVAALSSEPLPPGGKPMLDELVVRAHAASLDDLDYGPDPYDKPPPEPIDQASLGIAALLGFSAIAGLALAILAFAIGLNAILSASNG